MALVGGAAASCVSVAAWAQQPVKVPTIGYLGGGGPVSQRAWVEAFVQRLRELGWFEGRTVAIEYRWAEGTRRAHCRDRRRSRPAQGRCHRHGGKRRPGAKAGDISHPDRLRHLGGPGRHGPRRELGAAWR